MQRPWWLLAVVIPAGCLIGAFTAACLLFLQPKTFESMAIVEVKQPPAFGIPGDEPVTVETRLAFIEKQMTTLRGKKVAMSAVERGDFARRWHVSNEEAANRIRRSLDVALVNGTELIKIRAVSENRMEAKDLVVEVVDAYQQVRRAELEPLMTQQMEQLSEIVRLQEQRVEQRRKVLSDLAKKSDLLHPQTEPKGSSNEYDSAKTGFENDLKQLQSDKLKYISEKASQEMEKENLTVHEDAAVPLAPSGPNVTYYLKVGLLIGATVAFLVGAFAVLLFPKRTDVSSA